MHRDNEEGMSINLLYLKPNRLKLVKFPKVSGISHNSLCCKSKCDNSTQFPISEQKLQKTSTLINVLISNGTIPYRLAPFLSDCMIRDRLEGNEEIRRKTAKLVFYFRVNLTFLVSI